MIGTIRKHSNVLWWTIIPLTIVSFVFFMSTPGTRNGGGRNAGLGMVYGKPITSDELETAKRDYFIYYWRGNGDFPDRNPNLTRADMTREIYVRVMLAAKAKQLGIHISDDAQAAEANNFLRALGRDGQAVPMSVFMERVLGPEGLGAADFQQYIADKLTIDQLVLTLGLPGAMVPPQEASQIYDRENQEVSAQAVFFSATNFYSRVSVTPVEVSQFYTNYMVYYRQPDRVQINYVQYDLTNYLAAAEQKVGKTNITAQADAEFAKHGMEAVPDAKTPEEAKAKIREIILRQSAGALAADAARQFVTKLFAMDPVNFTNLVTQAKADGLTVHTTAPFTAEEGPQEFPAPAELTKTAFKLNADSPFSKPIAGAEAVYVIGLDGQLPSEIPPLSQIYDRVLRDYQNHEAAIQARTAGTNFYYVASVQIALGKTFIQAATATGQTPVSLTPFSLSAKEVPAAQSQSDATAIKTTAFTTQPGHLSQFVPTSEGGFVMFVQSLIPVDEATKKSNLPKYLTQLRHGRQDEAFNIWLQGESNRELRNTPMFDEVTGKTASSSP